MKLLFLTNFFPPASRGGYEQWCQEVALGLQRQGHELLVLTSRHGRETLALPDPRWVRRDLHLEMAIASLRNALDFFTKRQARKRENLALLEATIADFAPDIVLVWGMWNLDRSLAALAEARLPNRTVYYFGDYWPTLPNPWQNYWKAPGQNALAAIVKAAIKKYAFSLLKRDVYPPLDFPHALFPSNFMRQAYAAMGILPGRAAVVPGGVNLVPYLDIPLQVDLTEKGIKLLYAGRLEAEKGVHTAIDALGRLVKDPQMPPLHLDIVGSGKPEYERQLLARVAADNLSGHVSFHGQQPADRMVDFYGQADIFLFTSIWDEPFGRVIVEAQAAGTVVVGTGTGGAGEIISDNINGLVFSPGNDQALAAEISRLIGDPGLRHRLIQAARHTAVEKFSMEAMVSGITKYLQSLIDH